MSRRLCGRPTDADVSIARIRGKFLASATSVLRYDAASVVVRLLRTVALLVLVGVLPANRAAARTLAASRTVTYRGFRLRVPSSWPVYDLGRRPTTCVRFDRHAVYLGRPGADQRCPSHAVGRTESILLSPLAAASARAPAAPAPAPPASGAAAQLVLASHGLLVTATWLRDPRAIERALGVRSLRATAAARSRLPAPSAASARAAGVFTGLGFDSCATPSGGQMRAWGGSPYRGVAIYIGGANLACAQPNLTPAWVDARLTADWHLIPTYVGLQSPTSSCACAAIDPGAAPQQGATAAADAVARARALGIGPGSPIYDDMEAYARTQRASAAVLAFLRGWTATLHGDGYLSGVYANTNSGLLDLVGAFGSGYLEPDDIWIAAWNGRRTTSDPEVPAGEWGAHQRLHQYEGAHDETYGGVTINIDSNYLNGATAGKLSRPGAAPAVRTVIPGRGSGGSIASAGGSGGYSPVPGRRRAAGAKPPAA